MSGTRSAVIIGGGPAGCSAALGLIGAGFDVTLFEQRARWTGRVCGAFLNAEAAESLRRLGLEDAARARGARVDRADVFAPGLAAEVPLRPGLALPRETLEALLLDAVARAGGRVETGRRVGPEETFPGRLVVRADGRFAGGKPDAGEGWYGWNALFRGAAAAPGALSLHFHAGGYVGALTFPDGTTNVCGLTRRGPGESKDWPAVFAEVSEKLPSLRRLLAGAERASDLRGVGPLPYSWRLRRFPDALAAGDAGAVGDPYMGEGIARALGAGPLLAEALAGLPADAPFRDIEARYRALWNARCRDRLVFGGAARRLLRGETPLRAAAALLRGRPRGFRFLTGLFHGERAGAAA